LTGFLRKLVLPVVTDGEGNPGLPGASTVKTTHLALDERERALAGMRASEQQISLTEYVARLIRKDADETGLSEYLDGATNGEEARHDR
jgi:hypothetical protein